MAKEITQLLNDAVRGDHLAADRVFSLIYGTLCDLAHRKLAVESRCPTLETSSLVHEAYLRLSRDKAVAWESRRHFFSAAAEAMRRILIERARRRRRYRHGGGLKRVPLEEEAIPADLANGALLDLEEALVVLERKDPRKAEIVKLRYFAGFTIEETGDLLGLSPSTVKLDWSFARAWLHREMDRQTSQVPAGGLGSGVHD